MCNEGEVYTDRATKFIQVRILNLLICTVSKTIPHNTKKELETDNLLKNRDTTRTSKWYMIHPQMCL